MRKKIWKAFGMLVLLSIILLNLGACKRTENVTIGKVRLNIETYLAGNGVRI